ncbi:MAG: hypothetical protein KF802_07330 [Bdellovibrionaceae bacterium]|nr:hypothetical protein [Pseudobdellovibrionaceae bacterium]MBX3033017.1 hypothetical protein [Pseudobdellovibrionaceae bacterium]
MMKGWLGFLGFFSCLLPNLAMGAVNELLIDCQTPWPTTSVSVRTEDGKVRLKMVHHNGIESAPIYSGSVTPMDIPSLQADAEAFRKLGNEWSFEWLTSQCSSKEGLIASCESAPQSDWRDQKIQAASFRTSRLTEETIVGTARRLKFQLMLVLNHSFRQMAVEYSPDDCVIRAN